METQKTKGRLLLLFAILLVIGSEAPLYIGYFTEVEPRNAGEGLATLAADILVGALLCLGFRWIKWVFVCLRVLHALGILLSLVELGVGNPIAGFQIAAVGANLAAAVMVCWAQPIRAYLASAAPRATPERSGRTRRRWTAEHSQRR